MENIEWSILRTRAETLVKLVAEETLEISIEFREWRMENGERSFLRTRAETLVKLVGEEDLEISTEFGIWICTL